MKDTLKDTAVKVIDSNREALIKISKFIHSHPESNYNELECSRFLADQLRKFDLEVDYPYARLRTSFKSTITGGIAGGVGVRGPHVVILAEYDALPVTMPDGTTRVVHACGHNLNCAAAVGAMIGLKAVALNLGGRASIVGTPAEEGGGGKVALQNNGGFEGVDAIMTVHGDQRDWYTVARACTAGESLEVTFLGKPPVDGYSRSYVNAMDAVILFLTALSMLDSHLTPDSLIQRRLVPSSYAVNTIPLEAKVDIQIRSGDEEYLDWMKQRVIEASEGAARAVGGKVSVETKGYRYERIIENKTLEEVARLNIEALGHKFTYDEPSPYPFGTDTGNLSHRFPTLQFLIGRPEGFKFHTPEAVEQSASESAQEMMVESAKILALTTVDLLSDPAVVDRAKKELEGYRKNNFRGLYSWHKGA